ncbi:hypothetical protein UFOVP51_10 [uncultured Caudovirales phage]|uniref:Uncharacterized protein n=1 Tax=uncultured Caudovirales phage TaxID=2100421 RepID=A0A6J5KSF1_9CAUD|nr:hypothetical protein UFOVP51_10 [uncultured Caudovirales phage]CAB4240742.1 hypothetical protein UFOVP34_10 [uncultured Caudovirales phage]
MKLRSGKELPPLIDKLPEDLSNILEIRLQNFKKSFAGNIQHAKELLKIISKAISIEIRFNIRDKIEEVYDINNPEKINPLMAVAGDLSQVLIYSPKYHDLIEERIKNFDLETPLIGNIEE